MFGSTCEAGELIPKDPVEGSEHLIMELLEGNMVGALEPIAISTKRQQIAKWAKEALA